MPPPGTEGNCACSAAGLTMIGVGLAVLGIALSRIRPRT